MSMEGWLLTLPSTEGVKKNSSCKRSLKLFVYNERQANMCVTCQRKNTGQICLNIKYDAERREKVEHKSEQPNDIGTAQSSEGRMGKRSCCERNPFNWIRHD